MRIENNNVDPPAGGDQSIITVSSEATEEEEMLGSLEPFGEHTSLPDYLKRFEILASLNNITDDKIKSKWLSGLGGPILYAKLKKAASPKAPIEADYKIIKTKLLQSLKQP